MSEQKCDCGAPTEGKWADIHHPTCPAVRKPELIETIRAELVRARSDVRELTLAFDRLMDSLPPDFPDRAYYDDVTALHGNRDRQS